LSIAARPVTLDQLARLPQATVQGTLPNAPLAAGAVAGGGLVAHPRVPTVLYATPGGAPVGVLPSTELGNPTWVPVIDQRPGWVRVLLPSRPNASSGWMTTTAQNLARTPYLVRLDRARRRLTLQRDGVTVGSWPVAVGTDATPTPTGATFIAAQIADPQQTYSPIFYVLGLHSDVLASYAGGPATVAIHGWGDTRVFGTAASHGCVRVPGPALLALRPVPLGTLVLIQ
jgi:lipoprotein-anchoring transpeptidase ErfK/SrfK